MSEDDDRPAGLHIVPTPGARRDRTKSGRRISTAAQDAIRKRPGPAPTPPWVRDRIVRLLTVEHKSRNAVAREVGVSASTVGKIAREVGHTFGTKQDTAQYRAVSWSAAKARAELADSLLKSAADENARRDELGRDDAKLRADLSRSIGTLVRALADLASVEERLAVAERERRGGSDLDEYLRHMAGETEETG